MVPTAFGSSMLALRLRHSGYAENTDERRSRRSAAERQRITDPV
ncbi:MAG TPA: hypothetical protein VEM39_06210 [Myxococcaceae bacterium]|nr:hypothetical protein [Myxococcaceae bacterium]